MVYYCSHLYLNSLDSIPGFKYLKNKELASDVCDSDTYKLAGADYDDKPFCAKMCSDAVDCTAFEYKQDGTCRLVTWCGEKQTKSNNDWSVYLKGR